jgi:para-nitrobenzyl esterase
MVGGALVALSLQGRKLFGQTREAVNAALIQTPLGPLRGELIDGVRVFRGVPFAESPVGPLRFKPTVKVKPWVEERGASRFASAAMQDGEKDVPKSEDCLYLNVWTPPDAVALPVFVWIHGGGFTGGRSFDSVFDGTEFAKAGVVVVTVAYRLGVFGFLDMEPLLGPDYAGSGNNAVRDLICALEWVHENIDAFGGDPRRVTVGGESA